MDLWLRQPLWDYLCRFRDAGAHPEAQRRVVPRGVTTKRRRVAAQPLFHRVRARYLGATGQMIDGYRTMNIQVQVQVDEAVSVGVSLVKHVARDGPFARI